MSRIKELFLKTKYPSWIVERGYCRALRVLDPCCEILFNPYRTNVENRVSS